MSKKSKLQRIMDLSKRRRADTIHELPLVDSDGTDISIIEGLSGRFYIKLKEATLENQEELQVSATQRYMRADGVVVTEFRPALTLARLVDCGLLVEARLPILRDDDTVDSLLIKGDPKNIQDKLDTNLSYRLATTIVGMALGFYGITEGADTTTEVDDLGNLPKPSDDQSQEPV